MDLSMLMGQFIDAEGNFAFPEDMSVPNLSEMMWQINTMKGETDLQQIAFHDYSRSRDGELVTYTRAEVNRRIKAVAARLQQVGEPGDRVALLMGNSPEYLFGFLGAQYACQVAMPLYDPTEPGHGDHLNAVLAAAPPNVVLTNKHSAAAVRSIFASRPAAERPRVLTVDALPDSLADNFVSPAEDAKYAPQLEKDAVLLFTSGSSRTPEGVRIAGRSILSNVFQVISAAHLQLPLRLVTWLPLHHNMGIVLGAFVTALGLPFDIMTPRDFIQHPERWIEQMDKRGDDDVNIYTVVPNFALELANRFAVPEEGSDLDLSNVDGLIVGSEPVTEKAVREFRENFEKFGLSTNAIRPGYGLTEATLLVTLPQGPERPRVAWVSRESLNAGVPERVEAGSADAVPLISNGSVAKPQHLIVVDPETRTELPDGQIGEMWVHGDNIPLGYLTDLEQSAQVFGNKLAARRDADSRAEGVDEGADWMATGDLGVFIDDEIHITGRIKDLVVVAGRNHYPQDIEATVTEASDHIRPAVVAAFSVEGDDVEKLVIIAERDFRKDPSGDAAAIDAIRAAVTKAHGIQPEDIRIVGIDELPRSSAGKIARRVARAAYLDGGFE
ncbi:FadD32-like long-chain-fatty-acid--AMP ligase [Corynebacterium hansenii]|uniref:FadD32-like long-chain-fatty-acid--AMP ligase n=1 Tax=Corynebacterium hansenii TaxID=394964 RepID=A0ABV7ZTT9_9CORY|nr:FadD32-like long-chain-fatty-acid--AMP ligase [Corynebacterium hansenii]WJZ01222.1 Long-chain-fatty-acid--AMP ligase FadD32 [Corynebacterium hansenii]